MTTIPNRTAESAETRLLASGIELPPVPPSFGAYALAVQTGNLLFLSGMLPVVDGEPKFIGRIGKELDVNKRNATARRRSMRSPWRGSTWLVTISRGCAAWSLSRNGRRLY